MPLTNPGRIEGSSRPGPGSGLRCSLAVAGLFALLPAASFAAPPPAHGLALQAYEKSRAKSREALVAGAWERAHERSSELIAELEAKLAYADGSGELLGHALLDRAIAGRNLGQAPAAAWEYAMARALVPAIAELDPASLGKGGESLGELVAEWTAAEAVAERAREAARTRTWPPKSIGVIEPRLPFRKLRSCPDGASAIAVVVDARGRPSHPTLVESGGAPFDYALLVAARRWAFHPLPEDQAPIAFVHGLVFRILNCER